MREPIFWTNTKDGANKQDRQRERWVNGRRYTERVPQGPHDGSSSYDNPVRLPNNRARLMLKACGTEAWQVLTNAAAHIDLSTGYAEQQRMKARYFGWIPVGHCPVMMMLSGQLDADKVMERSFFEPDSNQIVAKACAPGVHNAGNPCPHYLKERAARRAAQKELMDSKQAGYANEADKLLETVKLLVDAQTAQIPTPAPVESAPIQQELPAPSKSKREDKDR